MTRPTEGSIGSTGAHVGPHTYDPLGVLDRLGVKHRCQHCMTHRHEHPVGWVPSRAYGDRRRPVRP